MGLANVFKNAAKNTVHLFAKDNGLSTFYSLLKDASGAYDPLTDNVQPSYNEYSISIAFDTIEDSAPFPHDFVETHKIAYIACTDLPTHPKQGDKIKDYNGVTFVIDNDLVERDQYDALYTVYIKLEPEDV